MSDEEKIVVICGRVGEVTPPPATLSERRICALCLAPVWIARTSLVNLAGRNHVIQCWHCVEEAAIVEVITSDDQTLEVVRATGETPKQILEEFLGRPIKVRKL